MRILAPFLGGKASTPDDPVAQDHYRKAIRQLSRPEVRALYQDILEFEATGTISETLDRTLKRVTVLRVADSMFNRASAPERSHQSQASVTDCTRDRARAD